jgi:O-antigen ligase
MVPFYYVLFSVCLLLVEFPTKLVLDEVLNIINWVYAIPIASFFFTGGSLSDTNIYYISSENESTLFVSNHYGWSASLFLVTAIDLLTNRPIPIYRKGLLIVGSVVAMYLVLISGNRTSWLSLSVVGLVFIFRYQLVGVTKKALLLAIPVMLINYLILDPKSALNNRLQKTEVQQKKGEPRASRAAISIQYFNEYPALWMTGLGLFNQSKIKSITGNPSYHNSYLDILFGTGIFGFIFFVYLLLFIPLITYLRFFASKYLFLFPVIIIPFFESNLTGGQFLFFPWFILVTLLSKARYFSVVKSLQKTRA